MIVAICDADVAIGQHDGAIQAMESIERFPLEGPLLQLTNASEQLQHSSLSVLECGCMVPRLAHCTNGGCRRWPAANPQGVKGLREHV